MDSAVEISSLDEFFRMEVPGWADLDIAALIEHLPWLKARRRLPANVRLSGRLKNTGAWFYKYTGVGPPPPAFFPILRANPFNDFSGNLLGGRAA